jgi:SAM-dependent methyltransferase
VPALVHSASGVVVELGPGTGNQLSRFDGEAVTKVYGVEPNESFIPILDARLHEVGGPLVDKYVPVVCGIEDMEQLARHGILPGTVDCVVSMQVMCSLEKPDEVARQLYTLLKPGGRLIFWEHARSVNFATRLMQRKSRLIYPTPK